MARNMTLRLTDEQAEELQAIARVENVPIAEEVRQAIADLIEARRQDKAFQARLRAILEHDREILQRLATT